MKDYLKQVLQDEAELARYCEIIKQNEVSLYLEIGSKFGGSLWRVANSMPKGSRIIAVDLPNGTKSWTASRISLEWCIADLRDLGYDARIIWGDSQSADVIRKVGTLAPFDAIMIDADHRLPGVTNDWLNYGPMARNMVAFHDISWKRAPEWEGTRIDVPKFWDSIKHAFRHEEIKLDQSGKNNGIGILWKD